MAIIADGRIVGQGVPSDLVASLKGRVWRRTIAREEIEAFRARYQIISTRLFAGKTIVHVLADGQPDRAFEPVQGALEDVYFSTLSAARKAA
jgi:hypothetical protein